MRSSIIKMNEKAYSHFSWYKLKFLIKALVLILLNSIIVFAKIDSEGFFNRFLFYVSALDLVIIACVVFKVRAAVEALCISTTTCRLKSRYSAWFRGQRRYQFPSDQALFDAQLLQVFR